MILTNPSQLATVLLLLIGAVVEAQDLPSECCTKKMVGNVSYTLLSDTFNGEFPSQCLNGCVYTVSGTSSPMFCFKKGALPSECISAQNPLFEEGVSAADEWQVVTGGFGNGGILSHVEVFP